MKHCAGSPLRWAEAGNFYEPPPFVLSLSKDADAVPALGALRQAQGEREGGPASNARSPLSAALQFQATAARPEPVEGCVRNLPFKTEDTRRGACKPGSVVPTVSHAWTVSARAAIPLGACCQAAPATNPGNWRETRLHSRECVLPLFGLAPGGVCHAASVAGRAVRSCRTLSPLPGAESPVGGLLSVALSLARLVAGPAGVTRHPCFVEPGLSSASGEVMTRLPGSPVRGCHLAWPRSRANSSSNSNAPICPSTSPSILCGRQRRWNAATAAALSLTS